MYDVTLPVKDFSKIEDSLAACTAPELASDYKCESCGMKGHVTRQQRFTRLAPFLMLSLTR